MNNVQLHSTHSLRAIPVSVFKTNNLVSDINKDKIRNNVTWRRYKDIHDSFDISVSYRVLEENDMQDLLSVINTCVEKYTQEVLGINLKLRPTGTWVTRQTAGGHHNVHCHPNTLLSAVTYFKDLDNNIANLVFKNNGFDEVFSNFKGFSYSSKIIKWNAFNNENYSIKPEEDHVIIFPGHLEHCSDNTLEGVRYCIGVNYFIDDTLGKDDNKNTITVSC